MHDAFDPDPRIAAASAFLLDLELCQVRLQLDARWPWLVLLPRRTGVTEIEQLSVDDRARLIEEATRAAAAVRAMGEALNRPVEKINIGALGNVVPQLHVHVVGRRSDDAAWPGPVWGAGVAEAYEAEALACAKAAAERTLRAAS